MRTRTFRKGEPCCFNCLFCDVYDESNNKTPAWKLFCRNPKFANSIYTLTSKRDICGSWESVNKKIIWEGVVCGGKLIPTDKETEDRKRREELIETINSQQVDCRQ